MNTAFHDALHLFSLTIINLRTIKQMTNNLLVTANVSLANSEDPDEMSYNAAFHQGLRCFLRQKKKILRRKIFS